MISLMSNSSYVVEETSSFWFDFGLNTVLVLNLAVFVVSIYLVVLVVKFLRRGIKYFDMRLMEKKPENKEGE